MASSDMFPPLKPTPEEHAAYQRIAQRLLDSTVQHYQVHTFHHRREMCRKRWKPVKSREYITVYKERDPQPHAHNSVGEEWSDPKLLVATGAIVGTLDDVMYGVVTPDAASMLLKASITKNRLVGGAVLSQLQGPTVQEPFRFLGIKWFVVGAPASLNGVIRSRDLVFVEATGIKTLPNGERIGFQLMQSVTIPGYGELESQSITRGRISSCSVFKQLANGTVDVYVRGYVEAFGKVMDAVALKFAASGFLSSWNSVGCARYKKLMWCVMHRHSRSSVDAGSHSHRSCAECNKRFGKFSSVGMCVLCKQWMCSRCRVVSKLRDVDSVDLSIEEKDVIVCNGCVAHVDEQSSLEIAQQEVRSGRFGLKRSKPIIKLWSFRSRSDSKGRSSATLMPTHDDDLDSLADIHLGDQDDNDNDAVRQRAKSDGVRLFDPTQLYSSSKSRAHSSDSEPASPELSVLAPADMFKYHGGFADAGEQELAMPVDYSQPIYTLDTYHHYHQSQQYDAYQQQTSSPPRTAHNGSPQQQQLYKQMLDLQAATEQIYQLTMKTTDAHIQRMGVSTTRLTP